MYFSFDFYELFTLSSKRKRCTTPSVSHSLDSSLSEGGFCVGRRVKAPSWRELSNECETEGVGQRFLLLESVKNS